MYARPSPPSYRNIRGNPYLQASLAATPGLLQSAWNNLPSFRSGPWAYAAANTAGRVVSNLTRNMFRSAPRTRGVYARSFSRPAGPRHGGLGRNRRYASTGRRRPRAPRPEVKYVDSDTSFSQQNDEGLPFFYSIPYSDIAQGTGRDQRIGNRIEPLSLHLKAEVRLRGVTLPYVLEEPVRGTIYIIQRRFSQTPDVDPVPEQLWNDVIRNSQDSFYLGRHNQYLRNPDHVKNLRIVKSYPFTVSPGQNIDSLQTIEDFITTTLPRTIEYDDTGAIVRNALYIGIAFDSKIESIGKAWVQVQLRARFKYTDA